MEYSLAGNARPVPQEIKDQIIGWLAGFKEIVDKLGLRPVSDYIEWIEKRLKDERSREDVREDFKQLLDRLQDELNAGLFVMIARSRADYFSQPDLLGSDVTSKFPDANADIAEAGKCFAAERYAGCVFHLMRVMEVGLLRLANRFKIPVTGKTWGQIIGTVQVILGQRKKTPRGKQAAVKYDSPITYFWNAKDGWGSEGRSCNSWAKGRASEQGACL
jgi:hypothetical protein